jgi:hypothetical protein
MAKKGRRTPTEVFLSHSAKDRRFAPRLADVLADHAVPVWYSDTNILGAAQWHDEIGAASKRCDWFVVVLSPHAVRSQWVKHELLYALRDARFKERIAPVMFRKCNVHELSWTLGALQMVDFIDDFRAGCSELLQIWGRAYKGA